MLHRLKIYFSKNSERFFVLLGQFTAVALIFGAIYYVITSVAQVDGYSFDPWLTVVVLFLWFTMYLKASSIELLLKKIVHKELTHKSVETSLTNIDENVIKHSNTTASISTSPAQTSIKLPPKTTSKNNSKPKLVATKKVAKVIKSK